jgi:hypothetical protein
MIATSYRNIPTDFIKSSQWVELNVRHFINILTVTRPAGGRHTKLCWLAQQNITEMQITKETNNKRELKEKENPI